MPTFVAKNVRYMMTKEEVAEIMTYCKEHQMPYKTRLSELGIASWRFFDAKSRYAREQRESGGAAAGEFLQLTSDRTFVPMPSFAATTGRKPKEKKVSSSGKLLSIELRTSTGTMMRIQGEMDAVFVQSIIQASSSRV